ncbi:MAG: efflux RND transporter periplasmic adaptor subunit [Kofleriaceae bacterium]
MDPTPASLPPSPPGRPPPAPALVKTLGLGRAAKIRRLAWRIVKWAALAAVVVMIGLAVKRARAPAPPAVLVTSQVTKGELRVTVSATGRLDAATSVDVGAEVSGRIIELTVDENDPVTRGQVLAVIDREQLAAALNQEQARLAAAQASVRQAQATVTEAEQSLRRTTSLAGQQLLAPQALDTDTAALARAKAAYDVAVANARLSSASVAASRTQLGKATIRSPIDGIVLSRKVEPGQTVTAGFSTPVLFTLAEDLNRMTLTVDVDEADVGRVGDGNPATFTVDSYPGVEFPSTVSRLSNQPTISQNVVTYQARLDVDNQRRQLRPGMTATATIVTSVRPDVVLVPNAALRFTPPGQTAAAVAAPKGRVWLAGAVDAQGKPGAPTPVVVELGATDGTVTEVVGPGLAVGAAVVVDVKGAP